MTYEHMNWQPGSHADFVEMVKESRVRVNLESYNHLKWASENILKKRLFQGRRSYEIQLTRLMAQDEGVFQRVWQGASIDLLLFRKGTKA